MMSNLQFYFAMGVPSIPILLSWLQTNQRAARIEATVDRLSNELKDMRSEMITLRDSIHDMVPLHERMARLEERTKV